MRGFKVAFKLDFKAVLLMGSVGALLRIAQC